LEASKSTMEADLDIDVGHVGLAGAPEHQQGEGEDGDEHESL
jgi:hypothetical protein